MPMLLLHTLDDSRVCRSCSILQTALWHSDQHACGQRHLQQAATIVYQLTPLCTCSAEGRTFVGLGWPSSSKRTFVGLACSASVEHKMTQSFGFGRSDFFRFIDLQEVVAASECKGTASCHSSYTRCESVAWVSLLQVLTDLGYAGDKVSASPPQWMAVPVAILLCCVKGKNQDGVRV
jgi:hypothetical protein